MTRDRLAEILDLESALQPRRKEAAKWSDQGCKRCEDEDVELHRRNVKCPPKAGPVRELIRFGREHGIGGAFQTGEKIRAKVRYRTDEVLVTHEDVRYKISEDDGASPRSHESLDRLLWGQLD